MAYTTRIWQYLAAGFLLAVHALASRCSAENPCPTLLSYSVVAEYPHDPAAFTQGIQVDRDCDTCEPFFWESTGLYGRSSIRRVSLNGTVEQKINLPQQWFAEGLVRLGDFLYQLTWQTGTIFKWRVASTGNLEMVGDIVGQVQGPLQDGWGLTTDGTHLIITDSSTTLYFVDPDSMQIVKRLTVMDGDTPVKWLNELEFIDGELWANVWQTECIARVDISTGRVKHWLLMHGLQSGLRRRLPGTSMDVLNGIAYDPVSKRMFVTGKLWPRVFEVAIHPPRQNRGDAPVTLEAARVQCIR